MRENVPAWAYRLDAMIKRFEVLLKDGAQKLQNTKNCILNRALIGIVRALRPYRFKPQASRALDFLQYLALVLYVPIFFFTYTGDKKTESTFFTYAVVLIAVVIFVVESIRLVKRFAHWKFAIKTFYGLFAVALGFIVSSIAKNYANNLTQIDPKYLSDFTGLLTVLMTWFGVLASIPAGIVVLSVFRLIKALLFVALLKLMQKILSYPYPKIKHFPNRILTKQKTAFPEVRYVMLRLFYCLGAAIACAVLLAPLPLLATYHNHSEKLLTQLLVFMDFRPNHSCSAATGSRVAFLERGYVSVATRTEDGYRFTIIQCDFTSTKLDERLIKIRKIRAV